MGLAAMVNLVLEQVHQQAVAPLDLDAGVAIDPHVDVEHIGRKRVADSDQAFVHHLLRLGKPGEE